MYNCEKKGYGIALQTGFNEAKGKYILMSDGDDTYNLNKINEFYNKALSDENIAMVIGSRFRGGGVSKMVQCPFSINTSETPSLQC